MSHSNNYRYGVPALSLKSVNLGFANSCMGASIAVSAYALAYRLHIQLRGDYMHLPYKWFKSVAIVK